MKNDLSVILCFSDAAGGAPVPLCELVLPEVTQFVARSVAAALRDERAGVPGGGASRWSASEGDIQRLEILLAALAPDAMSGEPEGAGR